ncbi:MAG: hypothetical protein ACQ9MH_05220 [Nitrospinales bacterium]
MRRFFIFLFLSTFFLSACTGSETRVKKKYRNTNTTVTIQDLTQDKDDFIIAGTGLETAIEEELSDTMFVVAEQDGTYLLKYKVLKYQGGSRAGRVASLGLSEKSRIYLKVKVAMFDESDALIGAWEVESWVSGGIIGGSEDALFDEAAKEIVDHMKGF